MFAPNKTNMDAINIVELLTANPAVAGNITLEVKAQDLREFAALLLKQVPTPDVKTERPAVRKPMSQNEALEYLGVAKSTLIRYRKEGKLQGHRLMGKMYYFEEELIEALQSKK
ncbi:MAG: helix-turn-helix domain-containing protein [Bacteroidales bacterium]